jgi:hypothetical protein
MLKMYAIGERDGKSMRLIILGLSHRNLDELYKKKGRPIKIIGSDVGLEDDVEIFIIGGKDERTMQHDFMEFVGPETEVHIDPKLKD